MSYAYNHGLRIHNVRLYHVSNLSLLAAMARSMTARAAQFFHPSIMSSLMTHNIM